jgi:hypothetical protein
MKKCFKTLVAVVCAALTFGLTSCAKDAEDLIVGSWNVDKIAIELTYGEESYSQDVPFDEGESTTMTFKKNGEIEIVNVERNSDTGELTTETTTGTYTVKDNLLTITAEGRPSEFNIESIDKNAMALVMSESGDYEGLPYTETLTMTLSKK